MNRRAAISTLSMGLEVATRFCQTALGNNRHLARRNQGGFETRPYKYYLLSMRWHNNHAPGQVNCKNKS